MRGSEEMRKTTCLDDEENKQKVEKNWICIC